MRVAVRGLLVSFLRVDMRMLNADVGKQAASV